MRQKRRGSIIIQVAVMFAVCILLTGGITFASQLFNSNQDVSESAQLRAEEITDEVSRSVTEYPAYEWLMEYWYEHADELDIEYDAGFGSGTRTEEKCQLLDRHHPGLQLKYADTATVEALPAEDQKLYAEIIYSWLISRVDQIKETNKVDYLFCTKASEDYDTQVFLFSAAASGEERGTKNGQVYTLGVTKKLTGDQRTSIQDAEAKASHFTLVDGYVDYYSYFGKNDGDPVVIGVTIAETSMQDVVRFQTVKNSFAAMGYQIILAVLSLLGILILVLRPMKKIQTSIRRYGSTKDSAAVAAELEKICWNNEIGELSGDVIGLTHELDDYIEEVQRITAEEERIGTELALAERIQRSALPQKFPPFPERHEFDIYASMDPAREVGGDFYDFCLIDEDHLCLIIADVSGKGIPAALFMMVTRAIVTNCAMLGRPVSEVLRDTNEALCKNNDAEMFVTIWIGLLEISTGRMTAANAGHEYPVIKKPGGEYEILKDEHGFVVGGMEGLKYKEYELQLEPGTKLFVYTDGLPEATDENNEMFGTQRMLDALNSAPKADPKQVLQTMQEHVDAFVKDAEQFDDLTMLCLDYKGE